MKSKTTSMPCDEPSPGPLDIWDTEGCGPQKLAAPAWARLALRVWHDRYVLSAVAIVVRVLSDLIGGVGLMFRQRVFLEAEVLFLRRQLALYVERRVKPRRLDAATRVSLALWGYAC
jgi:hypothetical protein